MKKAAIFILIFLVSSLLWAQNRYALVIGNANYSEKPLPNAINDTNDISAALFGLGYQVELKQNLQRLEMIREISAFMTRLRSNRNSEGFFWYAGHAMEISGENLLLPLDVNMEDDELIRATSYSVTDLTRQLGEARNKVNVVVLDACRVPPSVGGGTRSMGDTTRVLRTIPVLPPDLFIIYSTSPGTEALDGTGRRNSPFTEAFLNNISSTEPLTLMVNHVARETMSLTGQRQQRPYFSGSIINEPYYSLNPAGGQPSSLEGPAYVLLPEYVLVPTMERPPEIQIDERTQLEYEVVNGRSVTIKGYWGDATAINIPAQIQGLPVTSIGEDAFSECRSLTSVTIPSSVTAIGDYVFWGCSSLTSVTIPSSVTAIGKFAFDRCSSLTNITVDSRNPAYASIDGVLFDKNIRTLIAHPMGKTTRTYAIPSSVTSIGDEAFAICSSLTSVTIPSSVTSIGASAFYGCSSLTSVTIPSSVTSIGYNAFYYCRSLTDITVDSRNTAYASIDGILFDKGIRTLIAHPMGKTTRTYTIPSSVTIIGYAAFASCVSLTNVTIPSSVTSIGNNAFSQCYSLTSVTIPSSVASIGDDAFNWCDSLTSVTLSRRTQVGERVFPASARITYRD